MCAFPTRVPRREGMHTKIPTELSHHLGGEKRISCPYLPCPTPPHPPTRIVPLGHLLSNTLSAPAALTLTSNTSIIQHVLWLQVGLCGSHGDSPFTAWGLAGGCVSGRFARRWQRAFSAKP